MDAVIRVTNRCVAGHAFSGPELDVASEVTTLDGGFEVRVCKEHGAPVSVSSTPAAADFSPRGAASDTGLR